MTPKDKSSNLLQSFFNALYIADWNEEADIYSQARLCALIAVDEMILNCNYGTEEYCIEVRKEIEKL